MKQLLALIIVIAAATFLAGCRNKGSSAPAPTNVNVIAGDTSATVSWDMLPGVEYWIFKAAGSDISPQSCYGMPQCQMFMKAVSPAVVSGLANGTTYAFTINGRIDGGAGGPGSPSIQATPRLAGAIWSAGTSLGAYDLHGVTFGTVFVAAGSNGGLFSSADGMNWTPQTVINWTTTTTPLPNLNAASYYGENYLVVGAGGVILTSPDTITWTQQTNVPLATPELFAVSNYGAGGYVATGASGTIIYSVDGINWAGAASNTTNPLYGVTYGNGMYMAVGASGTLLSSLNGITWSTPSSISTNTLKGIAYGPVIGSTGTGTFVAVGANGTVVTSLDGGTSWTLPISPFSPTTVINAVTYGRQFIAVADDGSIFASIDGLNWTPASLTPTNSSPIYAVTHGVYDYSAVGAGGLNMHSM